VASRNDLETTLVGIWQELLYVGRVGIHDNFFELGGHSLLTMRMVSAIETKLLISIPINVLFQFATIGELSKYLEIESENETEDDDNTVFEQIIM
jgi:acyl carrier protein